MNIFLRKTRSYPLYYFFNPINYCKTSLIIHEFLQLIKSVIHTLLIRRIQYIYILLTLSTCLLQKEVQLVRKHIFLNFIDVLMKTYLAVALLVSY